MLETGHHMNRLRPVTANLGRLPGPFHRDLLAEVTDRINGHRRRIILVFCFAAL
jgi:hypothetical protein